MEQLEEEVGISALKKLLSEFKPEQKKENKKEEKKKNESIKCDIDIELFMFILKYSNFLLYAHLQ